MLTRPPPAPRTCTTGRAPRGAQVRPFGGLSPWPASSSKQREEPRARPVLFFLATPHPLPPRAPPPTPPQRLPHRDLAGPAMPAHQLPHPLSFSFNLISI